MNANPNAPPHWHVMMKPNAAASPRSWEIAHSRENAIQARDEWRNASRNGIEPWASWSVSGPCPANDGCEPWRRASGVVPMSWRI